MTRVLVLAVAVLVLGTPSPVHVQQTPLAASVNDAPFFAGVTDAASLAAAVNGHLAQTRAHVDRVLAVQGPRTVDNTLRPFDEAVSRLQQAGSIASITANLHPDAAMRSAAEPLQQAASALSSELSLNRPLYDALAAVPTAGLAPDARHYLSTSLTRYRRSGVDKDDATRARIQTLRDELTVIVQSFERNIREGVRRIDVDVADLEGLPPDFVAARKPNAEGRVTLTTAATDVQPVMTYARRESVRRRMLLESTNVAAPQNVDVLKQMVTARAALARALGYRTWADYDMEDRMSGSTKAASDFIDRIVASSGRQATADYQQLLARKRRDDPAAADVKAWETAYYTELVRQSEYQFDSQSVRPYFAYSRVRDGIFAVAERLYGLRVTPAPNVPTWHPAVEVFDVSEAGTRVGRIYLDMHPRAGKAGGGASSSTVRSGVAGRQLPEVVLICRFPGGTPGEPGLMTRAEVDTFFHEFGHLIHAISAGKQAYVGLTRPEERDFIEAPSQLFEEWVRAPAVLALFAKHHQTNEPIPANLVRQMENASRLGRGLGARGQMTLARLSLAMHDRDPATVDPVALHREFTRQYSPVPVVEESTMPAGFPHLANGNYSSSYYTYMWSLVIAKDLLTGFDRADLLDATRARTYRERILSAGGAKPARQLVEDFLGRPFNATAWERWVNGE